MRTSIIFAIIRLACLVKLNYKINSCLLNYYQNISETNQSYSLDLALAVASSSASVLVYSASVSVSVSSAGSSFFSSSSALLTPSKAVAFPAWIFLINSSIFSVVRVSNSPSKKYFLQFYEFRKSNLEVFSKVLGSSSQSLKQLYS